MSRVSNPERNKSITSNSSWQAMAPLRFPRCFANLVECLGHMYILGGAWLDSEMECGSFSSVYDVDRYDEKNNLWEGITALRVGRHDAGAAVLGRSYYNVSGKHIITL